MRTTIQEARLTEPQMPLSAVHMSCPAIVTESVAKVSLKECGESPDRFRILGPSTGDDPKQSHLFVTSNTLTFLSANYVCIALTNPLIS